MPFYDRQYAVFVVLARPTSDALWSSSAWRKVVRALQSNTESPRGKSAVRSIQYDARGKQVPYGRLGWDDVSHAEWTHQDTEKDPRKFLQVDVWTPSWNQCKKDNLAPDFFFEVANERLLGQAGKQLLFNQRVLAALAMDQAAAAQENVERAMRSLAVTVKASSFVRTVGPWGIPSGVDAFESAIQDMLIGHLFKPGDPHLRPLDLATFSESWQVVI